MTDNLKIYKSENGSIFIVDIEKLTKSEPTLVEEQKKDHHLIDEWLSAKFVEDKGSYKVYETDSYKFLAPINNHFGIVADVIIKESPQKDQYAMLSRLQQDCDYFLGWGNRSVRHLYYDTVEKHIQEMKKIWNCLRLKPEWLSMEEIEEYESKML
jgi:hypothetical protein